MCVWVSQHLCVNRFSKRVTPISFGMKCENFSTKKSTEWIFKMHNSIRLTQYNLIEGYSHSNDHFNKRPRVLYAIAIAIIVNLFNCTYLCNRHKLHAILGIYTNASSIAVTDLQSLIYTPKWKLTCRRWRENKSERFNEHIRKCHFALPNIDNLYISDPSN